MVGMDIAESRIPLGTSNQKLRPVSKFKRSLPEPGQEITGQLLASSLAVSGISKQRSLFPAKRPHPSEDGEALSSCVSNSKAISDERHFVAKQMDQFGALVTDELELRKKSGYRVVLTLELFLDNAAAEIGDVRQ